MEAAVDGDLGRISSRRGQLPDLGLAAALSPDNGWIAYAANYSGKFEIYVERFPQGGQRHKISRKGGLDPTWSPQGHGLYFAVAGQMMIAPVSIEESFRAGTPETILENLDLSYRSELYFNHPFHDVSPDGKNFVMVKDPELAEPARELRVVQNWFEELERLAPTLGN